MNIKSLITTSVISFISASGVQAAGVVPHDVTPVITTPSISWTGFYVGGQLGGFSGKTSLKNKDTSVFRDLSPKLSGFIGGFYVGSNFNLSNAIILGVETDMIWSGKKDIRVAAKTETPPTDGTGTEDDTSGTVTNASGKKVSIRNLGGQEVHSVAGIIGFKQKWAGATRVRIGFATADCIMPYVAGGVAYTQLEATHEEVKIGSKTSISGSSDETATMVGFTIGGGIDFAVTDNVLLRTEYRHSDYGKKKFFAKEKEYNFKTNDFRVGVAYKF